MVGLFLSLSFDLVALACGGCAALSAIFQPPQSGMQEAPPFKPATVQNNAQPGKFRWRPGNLPALKDCGYLTTRVRRRPKQPNFKASLSFNHKATDRPSLMVVIESARRAIGVQNSRALSGDRSAKGTSGGMRKPPLADAHFIFGTGSIACSAAEKSSNKSNNLGAAGMQEANPPHSLAVRLARTCRDLRRMGSSEG